ncbi:unnamed protein product, partial [Urochloa humidicola]
LRSGRRRRPGLLRGRRHLPGFLRGRRRRLGPPHPSPPSWSSADSAIVPASSAAAVVILLSSAVAATVDHNTGCREINFVDETVRTLAGNGTKGSDYKGGGQGTDQHPI